MPSSSSRILRASPDAAPLSLGELLTRCVHRPRLHGPTFGPRTIESTTERAARLTLPRLVAVREDLVRGGYLRAFDVDLETELRARGWRVSVVDHLWRNRHDRRARGGRRAPCSMLVAVAAEHTRDLRDWLAGRSLHEFRSANGLRRLVARARPRELERLVRAELAELAAIDVPAISTLADHQVEGLGFLPLRLAIAVRAMRALFVPAFPTAAYSVLVLRIRDEVFRSLALESDAQICEAITRERTAWTEAHRLALIAGFESEVRA